VGDASPDPVDHARTTRQHAGESMKNGANAPGLALLAAGVIATVVCLTSLATGYNSVAVTAALIAVLGYVAGAVWLVIAHRRVRAVEQQWLAEHPSVSQQPPTS
jgi:protein-S-isoprenylcysteine O-methyltransferase Ste14